MAPSISFPPAAQIEILNGSNWPLWSLRILALLRMNGLQKHVTAENVVDEVRDIKFSKFEVENPTSKPRDKTST
jgi:hypothetical protein